MAVKVLRHPSYVIQTWKNGGGTTYEIARSPKVGAWDWRVSMAVIASSGPFSFFEGVDRTLFLVEGEVSLQTPEGVRGLSASDAPSPRELIRFRGEDPISASLHSPAARDLNLMVRRAWGASSVTIARSGILEGPGVAIALEDTEPLDALGVALDRYDTVELEQGEVVTLTSERASFLFAAFRMHIEA